MLQALTLSCARVLGPRRCNGPSLPLSSPVAAAASQSLPQPLASLAGAPLGLQLPFLPLNGGMQAAGGLAASHALIPSAQPACMGMPLPTSQPPSAVHVPGAAVAGGSTLAPAQPLLPLLQQLPGGLNSGSHSRSGTDSAEGGSGEAGRRGGAARRTSEERLHATKEKNRRAQQRFRWGRGSAVSGGAELNQPCQPRAH